MRRLALLGLLSLAACAHAPAGGGRVKTGLDLLAESGFQSLRGRRVGLVTNHTGKDRLGRGAVDLLASAPGVTLAAVFSPEHGFMGTSEENSVTSGTLNLGGRSLPVYSLYSGGIAGMRPKPAQLQGLDALVFDIQDIGARFYTYLATMGMALEESAKAGVEFIVLDRPNPINGATIEGPVLDDLGLRQVTATAYFPVPVRHGLTAGEIALLHNAEVRHPRLTIVRMSGWSRGLWHDQTGLPWTPPSPNMPDLDAATLYPGVALFEAANLSVGRGTPVPFRWVGAPWLDAESAVKRLQSAGLEGVSFAVQDYTPAKSVYKGEPCRGVRLTITDRDRLRPLAVFRRLNEALLALHPEAFKWRWDEAKRMVGTDEFRRLVERGAGPESFEELFNRGAAAFEKTRKPFLLY